jgi:hypothetical protein
MDKSTVPEASGNFTLHDLALAELGESIERLRGRRRPTLADVAAELEQLDRQALLDMPVEVELVH